MISCEESHVCGNWASRQSCVGKKLCCFPRFSYYFRSSDSNAADVCFVVPLRTALRAVVNRSQNTRDFQFPPRIKAKISEYASSYAVSNYA